MESFRLLTAVVAAHEHGTVYGRTRLQKTMYLVQQLGFPTDYTYSIYRFGPYSEDLHFEIGLCEQINSLQETRKLTQEGKPYFVIQATGETAATAAIADFRDHISTIEQTDPVVLEVAATYHALRELHGSHEEALTQLRRMKGSKCEGGNEQAAFELLDELGLAEDDDDE